MERCFLRMLVFLVFEFIIFCQLISSCHDPRVKWYSPGAKIVCFRFRENGFLNSNLSSAFVSMLYVDSSFSNRKKYLNGYFNEEKMVCSFNSIIFKGRVEGTVSKWQWWSGVVTCVVKSTYFLAYVTLFHRRSLLSKQTDKLFSLVRKSSTNSWFYSNRASPSVSTRFSSSTEKLIILVDLLISKQICSQ